MEVSNVKGLANHNDPESCVVWGDPQGEALTGERAGWVLSRENKLIRDADPVRRRGRPQLTCRIGEAGWYSARSEAPGMYGSNLCENREILRPPKPSGLGRIEKSKDVRR
jgi:hypothetical protein